MTTKELYELQKIDSTQTKIHRRLLQIKNLLGESEELKSARQTFTTKEAELSQCQATQKDTELLSQTLADRIRESEARLMGGEINNPKELESLQASVESLRRQLESKEEEAVEILMMIETLTEEATQEGLSLEKIEVEWQKNQRQIQLEGQKLKHQYLLLKKRRVTQAELLDKTLLERYEKLRQRKAGIAVTRMENNSCTTCNVAIPTGVLQNAQQASSMLAACPSCGRILHFG